MQTKTKPFFRTTAIFAGCIVLLLSGCSFVQSNSFRYIDKYVEDIELSSTGNIIETKEYGEDSLVGTSTKSYRLTGSSTFNLITKTKNLDKAQCDTYHSNYSNSRISECTLGQLNIRISQKIKATKLALLLLIVIPEEIAEILLMGRSSMKKYSSALVLSFLAIFIFHASPASATVPELEDCLPAVLMLRGSNEENIDIENPIIEYKKEILPNP